MSKFRDLVAEVMDLAHEFSPRANPQMKRRRAILKGMATLATQWVHGALSSAAQQLDLRAEDGGQVGGVSPIAWMRIYSKLKSPSATAGFYVVYLFDAIGDTVYLSLNQGTSEFRAGQWRPITDAQKIIDSASAARFALEEAGTDAAWGTAARLNLKVQGLRDAGLFSSRDPIDRARNYEVGTVLAKAYNRETLPADEVFRTDLLTAVSSLIELYGASLASPPEDAGAIGTQGLPPRGLGRLSAPERRAVELRSMQVTREYYEAGGWTVNDVSAYRPYDLECTRGNLKLHVEVKGSTATVFRQIELTRNEVDHCRSFGNMELALVSGIALEKDEAGHPVGVGGDLYFVVPWAIDDARLTPLSFAYELPPRDPQQHSHLEQRLRPDSLRS